MTDDERVDFVEKRARELYRGFGEEFMKIVKDQGLDVAMAVLGGLIEQLLTLAMINYEANNYDFADFAKKVLANAGLTAEETTRAMRALLQAKAATSTCRPMH